MLVPVSFDIMLLFWGVLVFFLGRSYTFLEKTRLLKEERRGEWGTGKGKKECASKLLMHIW